MKTKLISAIGICAFALSGCAWFHSSQGQATIAQLEQYVLDEAQAYFDGTLTLQQLIDSAKAKFASFTAQQILDIILHKLDDPAVAPVATTNLMIGAAPRRPLVIAEKKEIEVTSYQTGVTFIRNGGTPEMEDHAKSLLARRLGYHYRVWPSRLRSLSDAGFAEGAAAAGEATK